MADPVNRRPSDARRLSSSIVRKVDVGAAAGIEQAIANATRVPDTGGGRTGADALGAAGESYVQDTWNATKQIGGAAAGLAKWGYNKLGAVGDEMIGLMDLTPGQAPTGNFEGVPMFDQRTGESIIVAAPDITPKVVPAVLDGDGGSSTAAWGMQFEAPQRVESMTTPKAGSDDMLTRMEGAQQRTMEYASMIGNYNAQIDELNRQKLAAVTAGANELAAKYDEQINDLRGRVGEAKIAMARSMEAYKIYSEQVGPAYALAVQAAVDGQAAQAEAMEGRVENVEAAIAGEFDASVENLEETAELVGAGSVQLSASLEGAMDVFEGMMRDAAVGRIEDVDRISAAAALFATAQSKAEKADDEFMTEIERQTLEIQIQSQLDQMTDQIVKLEADKKRAVAEAMQMYDPQQGFGSAEEAWDWAFQQLVYDQGWSAEEEAMIRSTMNQMAGVTNRAEAIEWLRDEGEFTRAHYGVLEEYLDNHYEGRDVPEFWRRHMQVIAEGGPESEAAIEIIRNSIEDPNFTAEMIAEMFRSAEREYDTLLDAWDMYEQNSKTWNESRAALAGSGGGGEAVANYNNRNQPAYVRRREIGVPAFVASFRAAFGKEGTGKEYVGGIVGGDVGWLRPPSMTGNGRSSNSDHLSGGAVDLYGATTAELEAIERWASTQPGVSFVVYSGNSAHQTGLAGGANSGVAGRGHVHVSLKVGYW